MKPGARNLITDVPGLRVGNAHDAAIKTGTTVLTADQPFTAGVHIMGGAPGTRETDLLAPDRLVQKVDALVLSGGSALGLDAASGVANTFRARNRGFEVGGQRVPIVPAAILFDLLNGGDKSWTENPYGQLGIDALNAASDNFEIGTHGAGFGATTATTMGGLGSASTVQEGHSVGALVAVNALGSATIGQTKSFWATPFEQASEFGGLPPATTFPKTMPDTKLSQHNTTIAIVATDAPLTQAQCTRLATAAHDGMARALVPSHTPFDGDLVFAASTTEGQTDDTTLLTLCHAAATTLARAIARGVFAAKPQPNDPLPCWSQLPE
ncbi:P1 family peptidase [Cognatishimia sp. MH4019]|uniref:P1 family peptidase n=1 Tax=Cognatishimia sp. MH4019 TaxID=2854030 RepID=UPI001CD7247F|nr:P1 family peptidase [Cognatishimia sp. MH4019]